MGFPNRTTAGDEPQGMEMGRRTAMLAGLAGSAAVGVLLGSGEFLAGVFEGVPSPLASVGALVVDNSPPALEDFAIGLFGTNDKLALALGTTIIALVIGFVAGRAAARRFAGGLWWLGGLGLVGIVMALNQPLISPPLVLLTYALAFGLSVLALKRLVDLVVEPGHLSFGEPQDPTDALPESASRRRVLGAVVGTGAASLVGGVVGRSLSTSTSPSVDLAEVPDAATTVPPPGPQNRFDIAGLDPIVVPNDRFYRIDTALVIPRVNPDTRSLRIHGMVDNEVELTLADLQAMPNVEKYVTIACVSNDVGGDLVGNAKWTGVRLTELLDMAGVQSGADQIVGRSVDDWTAGFPTELAYDGREPLLALAMNDEPLPARHGFPARLIVPGLYGYVSATKWISDIELTTWEGFDAYWIPRGWAKEGPIKTQSRIDVPRDSSVVAPGRVQLAGVAWAPTRGISKVEVSIDEGEWMEAEVTSPLSDDAWVQWRIFLDLEPEIYVAHVRATDGTGETQTAEIAPARPDGATGYHRVFFRVGDA